MVASSTARGKYASVNGLNMYYEVAGTGFPLVLIHGALMSGAVYAPMVAGFAGDRQVITLDLQAHGRTADIDRPLKPEYLADDVAELLRHLDIESADIFGYSLGAAVAVQVAVRHPNLVRKLIAASVTYNSDGYHPGVLDGIQMITPEIFIGSPMHSDYLEVAPNPDDWPKLVDKIKQANSERQDWPAEDIQGIEAPTMLVVGDSDMLRPEHAVEMFRLLGGGVPGDNVGLPKARLLVLPGTTHITLFDRADVWMPLIADFLNAPMPEST